MKNRILAILATAGLSLASSTVNAQGLTGSANIGIESEYVFRGVELAGESVQAGVEGLFGDGYFGIWTNEPLEDEYDSEVDFYAGYNYAINDDFTGDFGATVYYYPDAIGDDDTFEIYAGVTMDAPLAPSLYAFYDFDLEALTLEASLSHTFKVHDKGSIKVAGTAGWVDEQAGEAYYYYNVSTDYVYTFSEALSASLGVRSGGNDDLRGPGGKDNNVWGGATFNANF